MVGMMALGAGIQAIGGIFGGRSRKKAAKRAEGQMLKVQHDVTHAANQGIDMLGEDQARAIEYRAGDEARLKAATGVDMVKLVADAEAAGFNPLTVLNATGGAGYDGRGAVLTTPFIGKADGFFQKAGLLSGGMAGIGNAGQGVVQASGYVGDAMAGFGQNVFAMGQLGSQQRHEATMQANSFRDAAAARSAIYGGAAPRGQKGSSAPLVGGSRSTGPALPVPVTTDLMFAGFPLPKDPWTTDAGDLTQRYGDSELVSTGGGLAVMAADAWQSQTARSIHQPIGWAAQWVDRNGQAWSRATDQFISNAWRKLGTPGRSSGAFSSPNRMTAFQEAYR